MKIKSYAQFNESHDINSLFKLLHSAIDKNDLVQVNNLIGKPGFPSEDEIEEIEEFLNIERDFLYYNSHDYIHPFVYWKGPVFYQFIGKMDINTLKMIHADKMINQISNTMNRYIENKNYESLFSRIDKKILIPTFIELYDDIEDKDKYNIFIDLYVRSEYGFGMFPEDLIKDVFSKRHLSQEWKERMISFNEEFPQEEIEIWRGVGANSADENNAFSWTTSKKTAKYFADRFSKGTGKLLSKTVNKKEILDYLTDRGESEILLMPSRFTK